MIDWILEPIAYGLMQILISAWRAIPLIAAVLLIDLLFRRHIAARFHCMLWSLVIVRLFCPISVPSGFSVQGHFDSLGESMLTQMENRWTADTMESLPPPLTFDTFTFDDNGRTVTLPIIPADATNEFRAEADAYVARLNAENDAARYAAIESADLHQPDRLPEYLQATTSDLNAPQQASVAWDWEAITAVSIIVTWISVSILLLIRSVTAYVQFAKRLRETSPKSNAKLQNQLQIDCQRFGIRKVPVVKEMENLSTPAVFGCWSPTVCLPPESAKTLSDDELAFVLSHELAHIKRRDALLLTIAAIVRALHWFNPLMHLAYSRLRLYIEQAADDLATRHLSGQSSSDYGRLLLRYATEPSPTPGASVGLLCIASGKSLRCRLEMLKRNDRRNRLPARAIAVAVIVLIAITGLTDAKPVEFNQVAPQEPWRIDPSVAATDPPKTKTDHRLLVEQSYDVSKVLEKLAEEDPTSDPERSLLSLLRLPLASQSEEFTEPTIDHQTLTISQTAESHRMTQLLLRAIARSGLDRQISLSIRVLDADPSIASAIDWTRRGIMAARDETNSLDQFVRSLDPDSVDKFALESNDASYRSRPMFAVKVSQQQLGLLMQRANQQATSTMMMAPKVTIFNGQVAAITDQSSQPFLTGIKTFTEDDCVWDEPIIETVESGWQFMIYAETDDQDNILTRSVLTESKLTGVEQADLPFLKEEMIVQVPHVAKTLASSSAKLAKGESLVILSPHTYDPNDKPVSPRARFYILTPRIIIQDSDFDTNSNPDSTPADGQP